MKIKKKKKNNKQTDSLKVIAKKAAEKLEAVSGKKGSGGAIAKGQLPKKKVTRITASTKKACAIR